MNNYAKHPIVNIYLNYLNDFLTIEKYAEFLEVSEELTINMIKEGKSLFSLGVQ